MTNQYSDAQPALHSLNVSVRAGRLTKFKGRVASIAPGLSVVATVAVLLCGSVEQAVAQAACGPAQNGQVTCDAGIYNNGITYNAGSDGLTLILDDPNVDDPDITVVNTAGDSGVAVRGASSTSGPIAVRMDHGSVTTDAVARFNYGNHGLEAYTEGNGDVTAQMNGGDVTTHDGGSHGLRAEIKNAESDATAKAEMTGGSVDIHGRLSSGLSAETESIDGAAIAEMSGGTITTHVGEINGITASVDKSTGSAASATARMTGGLIRTHHHNSHGVLAESSGGVVGGDVRAEVLAEMSGGTIISRGEEDSHGVRARLYDNTANSKATATARMTRGVISTTGTRSAGISAAAEASCDCDAIAEMDAINGYSTITTQGAQAHGMRVAANNTESASEASATARMRNGSIHISGQWAHGISVAANGGLGRALAEMHDGTITTTHGESSAIYVRVDNVEQTNNSDNTNGAEARMFGGSILTTNRINAFEGSHGIYADTTGSADVNVDMRGGTITTIGRNSHGIWAEAEVRAGVDGVREVEGSKPQAKTIVNLGEDAVVTASGAGSNGIRVSGNYVTVDSDPNSEKFWLGVKEFDVDVAGIVTGGADGFGADDDGAAIRTISDADGDADGDRTIDITDTAIVIAGGSGIAIHTLTASSSGDATADGDGSTVITSAGMISGDIHLDAGDDTLIVTGGSIIGDVHGGEGDNTLTLTGGSFTGHLDAGAGDDTVTISSAASFDFSHALNGGLGDYDHLILSGRTMTSMENVINWEHLTLKDETKLSLDKGARLDMDLSIEAGSVFSATGQHSDTRTEMTIAGDVTNAGDMTLSVQDGAVGDVITIEGNYTGSGSSVFALDARMDGTDTDTLHFMGDVTGETMLSIASVAGVESAPLAIDVVTVDGASDGATFTLMEGNHVMSDGEHAMIAGAYLYRLAETDSGWALSALSEDDEITWQPASPLYDSYGAALLAFNTPASLRNRGSSQDFRSLAWDGGAGADTAGQDAGSPLWVQMGTEQITSSEEHSTTGAALESSVWEMQIGADIVLNDSAAGLLVGGLMLSYATGSTDVTSDFGDGSIDTTGLGVGLSATWYDTRGFYVDGQLTWTSYASDLSSDSFGTLTEGNSGTGYALSIEAGQRLDLGSRLTVIPQAQLSLSSVTFSDFTSERREGAQGEAQQEQVALSEATSQRLRLGLEFGEQDPGASGLYGIVNLYHEFGAGSEVEVDGASLTTEHEPWAVGVGLGGTYAWNDRVDLFGEASYATGLSNAGETSALSANAGLKVMF